MLRRAQSRADSLLEATTNVALGLVLALVTQALVYPLFGIATAFVTDGALIFTLVSLARSYLVRCAFETCGSLTADTEGSAHARP